MISYLPFGAATSTCIIWAGNLGWQCRICNKCSSVLDLTRLTFKSCEMPVNHNTTKFSIIASLLLLRFDPGHVSRTAMGRCLRSPTSPPPPTGSASSALSPSSCTSGRPSRSHPRRPIGTGRQRHRLLHRRDPPSDRQRWISQVRGFLDLRRFPDLRIFSGAVMFVLCFSKLLSILKVE